jgi:hypothetical protein
MNSAYVIINILIPLEQTLFPRGRAPHQKRLMVYPGIAQLTQGGLQEIGLKNTTFATCHTHAIHLIWLQ